MKYTCVCCGYKTLDSFHDWEVCPVCGWEDDVLGDKDIKSSANKILLSAGQENFKKFGASKNTRVQFVRPPSEDEVFDGNWIPINVNTNESTSDHVE